MTPAQRDQLAALARKPTNSVMAGDERWPAVQALHRERLVKVTPITRDSALVEVTDAGLAALAGGAYG